MKDETKTFNSAFILHPLIPARVAQLIERWSYKPEVEGLNPSLGTSFAVSGFKFQVSSFESFRSNSELETWNSKLLVETRNFW